MTLRLNNFPLLVPRDSRVSFHDGFLDNRHGDSHQAVDISAPQGTLVLCTVDGTVLNTWMSGHGPVTGAGWSPRGGNVVMVLDGNGYAHYFAHMQHAPSVRPGQSVRAGSIIGQVSNTGLIADGGPMHLHYQVWEARAGATERSSATFARRFGRAVNPHAELVRIARSLGATVSRDGRVRFEMMGAGVPA